MATNTTPFAFKLISVILDYLEVKCVAKFMWRLSEIVPLFLSSRKTTPRICKCLGCWLAHVERQCWLAQILAPQILRCWRQLETNAHAPIQLNCHNWRIDSELTNRTIVTGKRVAFRQSPAGAFPAFVVWRWQPLPANAARTHMHSRLFRASEQNPPTHLVRTAAQYESPRQEKTYKSMR